MLASASEIPQPVSLTLKDQAFERSNLQNITLFAESMHIKLDSLQTARLRIFYTKISSAAPSRGT